jgi:superfamily II DNA/RNA helicase
MQRNNKSSNGALAPKSSKGDAKGKATQSSNTDNVVQKELQPIASEPVQVVTQVAPVNPGFVCIYCCAPHKFSPFNVQGMATLCGKEFVFRRNPETGKYVVTIVSNAKATFPGLGMNSELVSADSVTPNHVLFWSDGISVFSNTCLIAFIIKNFGAIDNNTIAQLATSIYCPKWWEDLLIAVANDSSLGLSFSTKKAKEYRIYLNDFISSQPDDGKFPLKKQHVFTKFVGRLRTLEDIMIRDNERRAFIEREEAERVNEAERIAREAQELEALQKAREENYSSALTVGKTDGKSDAEMFMDILNLARKTHDRKYLASITPEGNVLADLIVKIGDVSKLEDGIELEETKRKYQLWKYFKNQEKLRLDGKINFKKEKWVDPKLKTESDAIPDIPVPDKDGKVSELKLTEVQKAKYESAYKKYSKIKKEGLDTNAFLLDQWQVESINAIRSGRSCLITGPTSGGKTFVMLSGLNKIIEQDSGTIIFVSPTFHLAYQTYANVSKTFPAKSVAIITSELIHIPKDARIIIGSACEILNYLITKKLNYTIGIFDEIHVASNAYCDESSKFEVLRAKAYAKLIGRCEHQVIAASATLKGYENMRMFIAEQMNKIRPEGKKMSFSDVQLIKYNERAVPLQEYRFDNTSIVPLIRNADGVDTTAPAVPESIDINSEHMFKLLTQMRDREITPAIIFEQTDDLAWKTYSSFVDYLEQMEARDYAPFHEMIEMINGHISGFNDFYEQKISEAPKDDNTDATRVRAGTKGNGARDKIIGAITKERKDVIESIISESTSHLLRTIKKDNEEQGDSLCIIPKDSVNREDMALLKEILGSEDSCHIKSKRFRMSKVYIEMAKKIQGYTRRSDKQFDAMESEVVTKGTHFKFGVSRYCNELLESIRNPGGDEERWKHRKRMIALAKAQNILEEDIDNITDVILRGLNFGIGIISSSLPFVIQNIILESLKMKDLGVNIASESMSMGINFPLRSVVIKGHGCNCRINPGKIIQMAGRCGRRGMDNQAHVIYYGIDNADQAHPEFISEVLYPSSFYLDDTLNESGASIDNFPELAKNLGQIFMTKYFKAKPKVVVKEKALYGGKEKEFKKTSQKTMSQLAIERFGGVRAESEDDIRERDMISAMAELESQADRGVFLIPIIVRMSIIAGFSEEKAHEIATMICRLDSGMIDDENRYNSFEKSQTVKILMNMIIELYNHYANSAHYKFLEFLEDIMIVLRSSCNKLIKYAR